jgi:hypothetical protein
MMTPEVIDCNTTFGENCEGLFEHHTQAITSEFLDELKSERLARNAVRAGEFSRAASVPTFVFELWMRQGLDPWRMPTKEIVKQLRKDGLEAFITARSV